MAEVEHGMEHVVDVLQRGNVGRFCHIGVTESENRRAVGLVLGLEGVGLDELRDHAHLGHEAVELIAAEGRVAVDISYAAQFAPRLFAGSFRPGAGITRAEFAKLAVSFFEYEGVKAENGFKDVAEGAWYARYVAAAAELGLVNGYEGGIFRPEAGITRAEASAIINRTLGRAPVGTGLLPEREMNTWPDNPADAWYYAHMQEATNSHAYRMSNGAEQWTRRLPEPDWDALQL